MGDLWSAPSRLLSRQFTERAFESGVAPVFPQHRSRSVSASIASITLGSLAGYVFAKLPFFAAPSPVPGVGLRHVLPAADHFGAAVRLFNFFGLIDTLWPLIIVHTAMGIPICTLLMRNFFATVPNALREAAILEGVRVAGP